MQSQVLCVQTTRFVPRVGLQYCAPLAPRHFHEEHGKEKCPVEHHKFESEAQRTAARDLFDLRSDDFCRLRTARTRSAARRRARAAGRGRLPVLFGAAASLSDNHFGEIKFATFSSLVYLALNQYKYFM